MPTCQFGSSRVPTQSRYQQFDVASVVEFLSLTNLPGSGVLGFLALSALGVPGGAIDLDTF